MRLPAHRLSRSPRRGMVFLACLLCISLMSLLVTGFSVTATELLDTTRDGHGGLRAELAAESAMAFALRQLALDPEWEGADGQSFALGADESFRVEMLGEGASGGRMVRVTGSDGESLAMLQAEIEVSDSGPGGAAQSCGLITYGGAVDTNNVDIHAGNVLIVDDNAGVLDWNPILDDWLPPAIADGVIEAGNFLVEGTLFTYQSDLPGVTAESRMRLIEPVRTPRWNLDAFLEPNPRTMIVTSASLRNLTTTKTVVVNVSPGEHISIDKCNLQGGLVVYSENSYTPRGLPRNTLEWKSSNFGSAAATGVLPQMGVFAPAAHVTHSNSTNTGYGMFLLKSAGHLNNITITAGGLLVLDDVDQLNNIDITYDGDMWTEDLTNYMDFGEAETRLLSLQEYYPEG